MHTRKDELVLFYEWLNLLDSRLGGKRYLGSCDGRMNWPEKGIYFFFEHGENRTHSGKGMRVVRVGTHAISLTSKTKLWNRLSTHRGSAATGGGNHRGSIFRLLIGEALQRSSGAAICATWGQGQSAPRDVRRAEFHLERAVSAHIGRQMPFLWLNVPDRDQRKHIEESSISLLSNLSNVPAVDPPSVNWLGRLSPRSIIQNSGLWNQYHTDKKWDAARGEQPSPVQLIAQIVEKLK